MDAATLIPGAVDENYSWIREHYRLVLLNAAAAIAAADTIAAATITAAAINTPAAVT